MVPAKVTVEDATAEVAAAALLLQDALPLRRRRAAALSSEKRAEDSLGDARESLALVFELVAQGQLGQPALDALGFGGSCRILQLPSAPSLRAVQK